MTTETNEVYGFCAAGCKYPVVKMSEVNEIIDAAIDAKITAGTTDLTAGTSALASGVIYLVYE